MKADKIAKEAKRISIDTRTIKKGDIFIAIKGKVFDGHDFVMEALGKGARLAVVSKVPRLPAKYKTRLLRVKDTVRTLGEAARLHRAKFNIPVVAITGSNGKTTAKEITSHVLESGYRVLKNKTSQNNLIGLPLTLLRLERKHGVAVLEMGMNCFGEIARLTEIARPHIGVITNIGPAHLERLGTLRNVLRAKSELPERLSARDIAILNKDAACLRGIKGVRAKKIFFGINEKCRFQASGLSCTKNRWRFSIGEKRGFGLSIPGRHNIYNALIAAAVARQLGIAFSAIKKRIKSYKEVPPMRLQFKSVRGVRILDDSYNSNPSSMQCAVDTLAKCDTGGRRIVVSGDMLELGKSAKNLHEFIGRVIARSPVDILITLGSLSKFMNNEARRKGMAGLYHTLSHDEAAETLKKIARPGDVILIKGSRETQMEKVIARFKGA